MSGELNRLLVALNSYDEPNEECVDIHKRAAAIYLGKAINDITKYERTQMKILAHTKIYSTEYKS